MDQRSRQPLVGSTVLSSFAWRRGKNECQCCGHIQNLTDILNTRTNENAFIAVRVIHWGDDFEDTIESNFFMCPACWDDDTRMVGFLLAKGFQLQDSYKAKFGHLIPISTDNQEQN